MMKRVTGKTRKISFRNFLMFFSLGAVLILLLLLSSFLFMRTKHFIDSKKQYIISTRMNQISFEVNNSFSDIYYMINNLKTNERSLSYINGLGGSDKSGIDKYYLSLDFEKFLYNIRQENSLIDTILVITPQSQFSSDHQYLDFHLNGVRAASGLEKVFNFVSPGKASESLVPPAGTEHGSLAVEAIRSLDSRMFFAANVTGTDGSGKGVIIILLNPDDFRDKIPYNENILLYDADRHLLFSGGQYEIPGVPRAASEKEGTVFFAEKGLEAHFTTMPFNGFRLIYVEGVDYYHEQLLLMVKLTAGTIFLAIFVAFGSSRVISRKVLYPVYRLIKLFNDYDLSKDKRKADQGLILGKSRLNLRERFLFYFILTILLPLLVYMSVFYWKSSAIVADDLQKSHASLFEKTVSLLESDMNRKEVLMARISFDTEVQNNIVAGDSAKLEKELLYEIYHLGLSRDSISIYDRSNALIFSNRYKQIGQLDPAFSGKLKASGRSISYTLTKDEFGNASVKLGMPIISLKNFPEMIGYITVDLDSGFLSNLYGEFKQSGSDTFIVDQDNRIVSHPDAGMIGKEWKNANLEGTGQDYIFTKAIAGVPWKFVSVYHYTDVERQVVDLFLGDSYLVFLIFLLMLIFAYYMSQRMLNPLGRLNQMLNEYGSGESRQVILEQVSRIDEVDLLGLNFNRMVRRIDDLVEQTLVASQQRIKLEYEKKEILMLALQTQINPHFLYNTLDNLIHLIETGRTNSAVEMINSLSRLFRYVTNREQTIRMRDEIMYARTYAAIMSHRYENFQCVWHIDESVLECSTIKLILQPLIENAIHHGARKTRNPVTIDISCRLKGHLIEIVVKDDALGMPEERLAEVRRQLADPGMKKAGIYNVNARIKLNYGEAYGLSIDSEEGKGSAATILLPAPHHLKMGE